MFTTKIKGDLSANAKQPTGPEIAAKINADTEFKAGVIDLAKRTQTIIFLREALFRLCEQSLNQDFSSEQVLGAYKGVIDTALSMIRIELEDAEKEKLRAETAKSAVDKSKNAAEIVSAVGAIQLQ